MNTIKCPAPGEFLARLTLVCKWLLRDQNDTKLLMFVQDELFAIESADYSEKVHMLLVQHCDVARRVLLRERATLEPLVYMLSGLLRRRDLAILGAVPDIKDLHTNCMRTLRCRAATLERQVRGVFATLPAELLVNIVLHSCFDLVHPGVIQQTHVFFAALYEEHWGNFSPLPLQQ